MLAANIEQEISTILKNKGKGGWLRVRECAKMYGKGDASKETNFYRWLKKVEKGKVDAFQNLKLPGNISFIGLKSADPKTIEILLSEDKKFARSIRSSGFGFFAWLDSRVERKRLDQREKDIEYERETDKLKVKSAVLKERREKEKQLGRQLTMDEIAEIEKKWTEHYADLLSKRYSQGPEK